LERERNVCSHLTILADSPDILQKSELLLTEKLFNVDPHWAFAFVEPICTFRIKTRESKHEKLANKRLDFSEREPRTEPKVRSLAIGRPKQSSTSLFKSFNTTAMF
jgi:hypothetical protein